MAEDFTPSCHKNGRSCHISIVFRMIIRAELLADVTSLADDHWGRWLAFHLPCCHLRLRIFLICFWNRKPTLSDGTKQRWERKKRVNFYFFVEALFVREGILSRIAILNSYYPYYCGMPFLGDVYSFLPPLWSRLVFKRETSIAGDECLHSCHSSCWWSTGWNSEWWLLAKNSQGAIKGLYSAEGFWYLYWCHYISSGGLLQRFKFPIFFNFQEARRDNFQWENSSEGNEENGKVFETEEI